MTIESSLFRTDVTQDADDKDALKLNLIISGVLNKFNKWICSATDIYRKAA